jgi:hypothetical protein
MHEWGPLWYRGYYKGNPKASIAQIDSSLAKFDVRHIITGHTIIADTISVLYDGKLFDTDVHHAKGKSEAIFIEDGKFFRCCLRGEKATPAVSTKFYIFLEKFICYCQSFITLL